MVVLEDTAISLPLPIILVGPIDASAAFLATRCPLHSHSYLIESQCHEAL